MMYFLLSLFVASLIGTVLWAIQNIFKPVTQKLFSQTWHYYTALIPIFFLLGGAVIIKNLFVIIMSALTAGSTILPIGDNTWEFPLFCGPEQNTAGLSFVNQLFVNLSSLEIRQEILMTVIFIWAASAIVFLAVNTIRYWKFKHSVARNSRVYSNIKCPVKVIISTEAATPMVMGFLKPVVILPDIVLTEKELYVILSHELAHVKRGDLFVKLIVLIAKAVHWFNPTVYILSRHLNILCELSCDEKIVREMDIESRKYYGNTILSILDYSITKRNSINVACVSSLCNSKKNIKRRLISLMNAKKTKKSILALSLATAIGLTGIGAYVTYAAESITPKAVGYNYEYSNYLLKGGSNVTIQSDDGKVISYDKNGNETKISARKNPYLKLTDEQKKEVDIINEKIQTYLDSGIPTPQIYIDELNRIYEITPYHN